MSEDGIPADLSRVNRIDPDFLAIMSHELRTPLNVVLGYSDLLLLGVPDEIPDGIRTHVERIRASTQRLIAIIEEVLAFARVEASREELHLEAVELGELAREAAARIEPLAAGKELEFHVVAPEAPIEVTTDPAKVRHILHSLLSNAVKFTARGEVRLELDREDDTLLVRVSDTGIGIRAGDRARIFDPFWQVEHVLARRAGGTGLGLAVARRLARLLSGDIAVDSMPGQGSTFTVRLPVPTPPMPDPAVAHATNGAAKRSAAPAPGHVP